MSERVEVLIIGGGQSGLAMSRHLGALGVENLVVERHRIAEAWRTARWDSLVANGPAWHDRFPDLAFDDLPPDSFAHKDRVARYFADFAQMFALPVREGVAVQRLAAHPSGRGFVAETSAGPVQAAQVVVATGPYQVPHIPPLIAGDAGIHQLHSRHYTNPAALTDGGVLVVGAGSSGVQIADELLRAGRRVWLSVGPHDRPPRRYRGQDYCHWLGVLGKWDMPTPPEGREHVTIAVSGAHGGFTVDFRDLAARGMRLVGRVQGHSDGVMHFAPDLAQNIARGDAYLMELLDEIDAWIARHAPDTPPEPEARMLGAMPADAREPTLSLDLKAEGISTVLWATGYQTDFSWIALDAFDLRGRPRHDKGVSVVEGLYFIGLPWLSMRGSSFIWGAYKDAARLAAVIARRAGLAPGP